MGAEVTSEEKKAQVLIGLRGYNLVKREEQKNVIGLTVETPGARRALIWCIPTQGTVGVQYINQLRRAMREAGIDRGIIVTGGRYTQAAKVNARKRGIELIPRIFPSFKIFEHVLVPKHEILKPEEREKVLMEYRVQPYQLPRIKASDPAAKAIGARPGDVVRIVRDSLTAGKYISYRYVVEG
ncbi:MAG: DNA-directed RNA polymerase subunit H [Candidatus Bathyarchaeota archaeon BA1]|nr:MAG: DNA-directed RNA polymerase subunit H [Candidatus Bathyarchaeota archaeon BA1]